MDGMLHQSLQLLMAARERVQPELAQSIVGALSEAQGYLAQAGKQVELVDRAASEAANLVTLLYEAAQALDADIAQLQGFLGA